MNEREEDRILSLLYEETSELGSDQDLSDEADEALGAYRDVLARVRSLPDEEPSPHLDALILAQARAVAEKAELAHRPWWRRLLSGPGLGLALATSATVFVAVLVVPQMRESQPELQSIPATTADEPAGRPKLAEERTLSPGVTAPAGAPRQALEPAVPEPIEELEPEREEGGEAKDSRRARRPTTSRARAPVFAADDRDEDRKQAPMAKKPSADRLDDSVAGKGDDLGGRGSSSIGTLSGVSGGAPAGAGGRDKERALRDGVAELDGLVSKAKNEKKAAAEPPAEAEMARTEAPARAPAPPPAPAASAEAAGAEMNELAADEAGSDPRPSDAPAKRSAAKSQTTPTTGQDTGVGAIRARARSLELAGDVEGARRYLLATRRSYVGKPMYEEVSYELAEFELRQKRLDPAEAYARDVLTTKDAALAARARLLIQQIRSAPR